MITLEDSGGFLWTVTADQFGSIIATKGSSGTAPAVFLNDKTNTTSWQLSVSTAGLLQITAVGFNPYPLTLSLSPAYNLGVVLPGNLQTIPVIAPPPAITSVTSTISRTGELATGQIVPLTPSPNQEFAVTLQVDGAPLTLELTVSWNEMAGYWVLSISDAAGSLLVDSIPLITGWYPAANLLAQYGYLKIGSAFILNEGSSPFSDYPGRNDLGSGFVLLWGDTAA